jgi:hypothetical protein
MAFYTSNTEDLLYMDLLTRIENSLKNLKICVVDFLHYGITWRNIKSSVQKIANRLNISFEFHYCKKGGKCTRCAGQITPKAL